MTSLAIYYEHPTWFVPLFEQLERRGIGFIRHNAVGQVLDPWANGSESPDPTLVLNRLGPSAWERGHASALALGTRYLACLEARGVRVLNGSRALAVDVSKAAQVDLLRRLGLPVPKSRVVSRPVNLLAAAEGLRFPVVVKPDVGGNGAAIQRFDSPTDLAVAVEQRTISSGPDGVLLVQEYHPPQGGAIVRIETLGGRFLYAIRIVIGNASPFTLCPADLCNRRPEQTSARVEVYRPSSEVIAAVEKIAAAAHLDLGGVELLESERDGQLYFFDINALSNFVAAAESLLGFDPTERLVDFLQDQLVARAA